MKPLWVQRGAAVLFLAWITFGAVYSLPAHIWRILPPEILDIARDGLPGVYALYKALTGVLPQ